MSGIEEIIATWTARIIAEENAQIEGDLMRAMGSHARLPVWIIKRLGYEVVHQKAPNGAVIAEYRGIRRRGQWLVDHHPDWPFNEEVAA
ncbi:hypothetical protein [Frigoribacterium sp. UYMn621]|uniref:hypothetical protein n=1 Tax=Frigoribacterium sp. UYMn621 TaxID=3156343 RepID=UPI0033922BDF